LPDPGAIPILRDPAEQEVFPLGLLFELGVSQLTRHPVARPT